jgi:protein-tyrosine phosphatase
MIKVLFVCMGNICRSPAAEEIFRKKVEKAGLAEKFEIVSAGTHGYHVGKASDSRMQEHARRRGYILSHKARQFETSVDYEHFDYILYMDEANESFLKEDTLNSQYFNKLKKLTDFASLSKIHEVPDPYYSGAEGFERVLDILDDSLSGLLAYICEERKLI